MTHPQPPRRPVSTYRLQLHGDFRFADAQEVLPYLAALGVTECYSSPLLKANPGSKHGYDICEHGQVNPELGSRADFDRFCDALQAHGLGHIVDIVPNHMACDPRSNPWWRDVLENGPSSPFSSYFDIDWEPIKPELKGKVLLPVLGDQYGRVLERGELQLRFADGALHLRYFDQEFPVNPRRVPLILGLHLDELERDLAGDPGLREYLSILTALQNLPANTERDAARIAERQREKEVARERLARLVEATPRIRTHVEACIRFANGVPGQAASFDLLHGLLELQAYRLAYWRTASDEINYRRFFDINELVALRMEEPAVFDAAHGLVRRLVGEGKVTGLRVDHPDGLFDPAAYFDRLQQMAKEVGASAGRTSPEGGFYVVAEKILSPGESLSPDWQVCGTTGYGFLNAVSGLFVDGRQVRRLERVYARFTGLRDTFGEVAYQSKRTIMLTSMASELNVLAHALNRLSERDRQSRDFTLNSCRKVLREAVACFSVYRTYVSARGASAFDHATVEAALVEARRRNPLMEASIFDFLRDILLPPPLPADASGDDTVSERLRFAMKMQQYTSPVQAKGVEDTAFYRYHVLISGNDVGGHPDRPAVSPSAFHEANRQRAAAWPLEMNTTATHDTKRGEDARMRLNVLSEMPDAWRAAVSAWARINARHRTKIQDAWAPDRNDEYLFYQALLGAWPVDAAVGSGAGRAPADLVARLGAYMQKAVREAKVHTSWIDANPAYTDALARFVEKTLTADTAERFLASFRPLARRVARLGMINSLSQLVLKLASPGVPDCYQGSELWDLSLVDPDNRRPVDFAHRRRLLDSLEPLAERVGAGRTAEREIADLVGHWEDGRIKLFVLMCGLRFRRDHPALMAGGAYQPLALDGPAADHLVAFARHDESGTLLAVVPRLIVPLAPADRPLPLGDVWASTLVVLPEALAGRRYAHVLTGEIVEAGPAPSGLAASAVFRTSPVALLWARAD